MTPVFFDARSIDFGSARPEFIALIHLPGPQSTNSVVRLSLNKLGTLLNVVCALLAYCETSLSRFSNLLRQRYCAACGARQQCERFFLSILALTSCQPKLCIEPLYALLTRYPPSPNYLTPIHQIFLLQCISARVFSFALPILEHHITEIDTYLCPDLSYNDNLLHHYLGGVILAALKKWGPAEEHFEICATSPGSVPAAIQLEALKKLKLVQLISKGQVSKTFGFCRDSIYVTCRHPHCQNTSTQAYHVS